MRSHLYAALGALKVGMDILNEGETVSIDKMTGHGGLFKTEGVGQRIMLQPLKHRYLLWKQQEKADLGAKLFLLPIW